jgi:hypothetical protein
VPKPKSKSRKPKTSMAERKLIIGGRAVSRQDLPVEFHIPALLLDQILTAANVPNQHRSKIRVSIESTIITWMGNERIDQEIKRVNEIRKRRTPILRIARQAEKLSKSLQQLELGERFALTASLTVEEEEDFIKRGEFWLSYLGTEVVPYERELRRFAELARRAAAKPARTVSHRPRFSSRHVRLINLIGRLYDLIVVEAGGELTLWADAAHDDVLKGTLPTILDLLRPILPHTIPDRQKLHYSTISRLFRQAKNPQKF